MMPYRASRRAFLAGVGGAVGLQILLRNLEAAAEGASSPPRFLMTHWPGGTARARFLPTGERTDFRLPPMLAPFENAGLREDLIILYGLSLNGRTLGGGGHEGGTVLAATGCDSPGTRLNGGEADDSVAGGPSFDQVFRNRVTALQRPGLGFVNAICDSRVDSHETSTQCLSYSYQRRQVPSARELETTLTENVPLMPVLAPVDMYAALFSAFIPGQNMQSEATRALRTRKSVLDSALRELARLQTVAPASQREKIEIHTEAIRKVEVQIQTALADGGAAQCAAPTSPNPDIRGKSGSKFDYTNPKVEQADDPMLEQTGKLHLSLIRAAFQCDLLRVATFQWCPGTNHVAFQGLHPEDPTGAYMYHPMTHRIGNSEFFSGEPPAPGGPDSAHYEFVCNVHTWFNQKNGRCAGRVQVREGRLRQLAARLHRRALHHRGRQSDACPFANASVDHRRKEAGHARRSVLESL